MNYSAPPRDDLNRILRLIFGSVLAKTLYVAAKLGVADELVDGPLTADELARRTQTNRDALYRVLRALAHEGLFDEIEPCTFALTDMGRLITENAPGSRKYLSLMFAEHTDRAVDHLVDVVRTGEPAAQQAFGKSYWEWLSEHQDAADVFNRAMVSGAAHRLPALLQLEIWPSVRTVVDVGGGNGTAVAALLRAHPHLRGTVFDLPHAEAEAKKLLEAEGVADRTAFQPGDFFKTVPADSDVYVLFQVLHNWSDVEATRILRTISDAIPGDGCLIVLEDIVSDDGGDSPLSDLQLLALLGGRERTEAEWRQLLAGGGFEVTRITPGPRASAIEARPV